MDGQKVTAGAKYSFVSPDPVRMYFWGCIGAGPNA